MPSFSATATAGPCLVGADQDRLGADIGEVELQLLGPIGRVERRGGGAGGDRDEGRGHLRPVRQDDGDAVVAAEAEAVERRGGGAHLRAQAAMGERGAPGRADGRRVVAAGGDPFDDGLRQRAPRSLRFPSMDPTMTSPRWTAPTPAGVPVKIRSPGLSVNSIESWLTISGTFQIIWARSPACRGSPLRARVMRPVAGWPTALAGCSGPQGAEPSKALAASHDRRIALTCVLQVAPRHVEADRVAEDAVEGIADRDVRAALRQRHHQLDLVLHVLRLRRIAEDSVGDEVVRVLLEEEGRLAVRVAAHLDGVVGIVAADAVDTVDGEKLVAAGNRQNNLRPRLHGVDRAVDVGSHIGMLS